jgi:hypothetical protein
METHKYLKHPTRDELRAARIAGFMAALGHLSPGKRDSLLKKYEKQNARREAMLEKYLGR